MQGPLNLVCVYAPTLQASAETKDQFYESLDTVISKIPATEHIYLLGDFNARVGADRESWPNVLGHYGIGKMNENGQRLLELCCYRKLCVTNTYFQNKACHKVSWRHPRSKHWHQLDMIITKRDSLNNVCNTRFYQSADCDTDHSLIATKVKLKPKKFYHSKRKGQPRINISKTAYPEKNQEFNERLGETLNTAQGNAEQSAEDSWNSLRNAIYSTAVLTYGKKERKNKDWFEAGITQMEPVIEAKRSVTQVGETSRRCELQKAKYSRHHDAAPTTTCFSCRTTYSKRRIVATSEGCMRASNRWQANLQRKLHPWNPRQGKSSQTRASKWEDG